VSPSAQADDIGARLAEPSPLSLDSSATGVPTYKMDGSMIKCVMVDQARSRMLWARSKCGRGRMEG